MKLTLKTTAKVAYAVEVTDDSCGVGALKAAAEAALDERGTAIPHCHLLPPILIRGAAQRELGRNARSALVQAAHGFSIKALLWNGKMLSDAQVPHDAHHHHRVCHSG